MFISIFSFLTFWISAKPCDTFLLPNGDVVQGRRIRWVDLPRETEENSIKIKGIRIEPKTRFFRIEDAADGIFFPFFNVFGTEAFRPYKFHSEGGVLWTWDNEGRNRVLDSLVGTPFEKPFRFREVGRRRLYGNPPLGVAGQLYQYTPWQALNAIVEPTPTILVGANTYFWFHDSVGDHTVGIYTMPLPLFEHFQNRARFAIELKQRLKQEGLLSLKDVKLGMRTLGDQLWSVWDFGTASIGIAIADYVNTGVQDKLLFGVLVLAGAAPDLIQSGTPQELADRLLHTVRKGRLSQTTKGHLEKVVFEVIQRYASLPKITASQAQIWADSIRATFEPGALGAPFNDTP